MKWATKIFDILTGGKVLEKIIDKLPGREKMTEAEKAQAELAAYMAIQEALAAGETELRDFFIEYEGAAKDMPRSIQIFRGMVRPLVTYVSLAAFIWVIWYQTTSVGLLSAAEVDQLLRVARMIYVINLVVFSFWFGEKLVTRTGLARILGGNGKNGNGGK